MIRSDVISGSRTDLDFSSSGGLWWEEYSLAPLRQAAQTLLLRGCRGRAAQELGEAQQRVAAHGQGGEEADLLLADHLHLAHRPAVLAPAEALLDSLAQSLAGKVTGMARRACIDRRVALRGEVHRHVRSHPALTAVGHEVGRIVALVRCHRALLLGGVPI